MAIVMTIKSPVGWTVHVHDDDLPKTEEENQRARERVIRVAKEIYRDPQARERLAAYNLEHYGQI